jgi:hypothetical protein
VKKFLRNAAITGVPFGIAMGLANSGRNGGLVTAVVGGILFGGAMAGFMAYQEKRSAKLLAQYEPEGIVHHGPANHMAGLAVGGWLVLTRQRLVFEPHKANLGGKRLDIAADDIAGSRPGDGIVPNKIAVATRGGQTLQFVVRDRATWLAKLPGVKPS